MIVLRGFGQAHIECGIALTKTDDRAVRLRNRLHIHAHNCSAGFRPWPIFFAMELRAKTSFCAFL